MSLLENMMETCVVLNKTKKPDGEGGFLVTYEEGAEFQCAITLDTSMTAKIALADGVTSVYTVTTNKNVKLDFHDVIKRLSDGKTFRITSDYGDKNSPSISSLNMAQVTAEKWELTQ